MTVARTGGCLCGAVRYESTGKPLFSLLCHCRDCQQEGGSAYMAAMRVPASGFRVTKGEPKLYVSSSGAGNRVTRAFCPECGCPLFIRVSARPEIVGLRVGSLDDPSGFRPEADIFVKSAPLGPHEPGSAQASDLSAGPRLYAAGMRLIERCASAAAGLLWFRGRAASPRCSPAQSRS